MQSTGNADAEPEATSAGKKPDDRPRDEESTAPLRAGPEAAGATAVANSGADDGDEDEIEEEQRNKQDGSKNAMTTLALQDEEEQNYGFYHPAASRPQRTVWIPEDEFGVSQREEKACKEAGVRVSSTNGYVRIVNREKGKVKVDVKGGPPDLIGVVI